MLSSAKTAGPCSAIGVSFASKKPSEILRTEPSQRLLTDIFIAGEGEREADSEDPELGTDDELLSHAPVRDLVDAGTSSAARTASMLASAAFTAELPRGAGV